MILTKNPTTNLTSSLQQQWTPSWDNSSTAPPIPLGVDEGGEGLKDYEGAFLPPKDDPKYDLPPLEEEIFGKSQGSEQEVDAE